MRRFPLIGLMVLWSVLVRAEAPAPRADNALRNHPSPYLAMHADDPVRWQLWDAEAFARARDEGKPLYVSSGYFSCHWCHVMQQESYRDPGIAELINRNFIPVKIDRELWPSVDAALIDFTERTRGQAGWPLNVFLTPEGYPLLGLLYLPPSEFAPLLDRLARRWRDDAVALTATARAAVEASTPASPSAAADLRDPQALSTALRNEALRRADELQGGFGAQAKFPMAPQLLALLQDFEREPDAALGEFLQLTLDEMAQQGLQDHLGGGFFRYTTDPDWQTPHFEKMLYDNALLVRVYLEAARVLERAEFRAVARRTLDFILDELQAAEGGYYAALSAVDAAGVEGGHYLWSRAEVEQLAGRHWPLAERYWGFDRPARFAAGHVPLPQASPAQLAGAFDLSSAAAEAALDALRTRLLQRRAQRRLPVDDQVLAGWNGLVLWALADAVAVFEPGRRDGRYGRAAQALQRLLSEQFIVDRELVRARHGAGTLSAGTLEDYAYVIAGIQRWLALAGATDEEEAQLQRLIAQAWARFYNAGTWRLGEDALVRWGGAPLLADGPMPAPAAVLLAVSRERRIQTERSAEALGFARPWVREAPFAHATYVGLYQGGRSNVAPQ